MSNKYPNIRWLLFKDLEHVFVYDNRDKAIHDLKVFNKEKEAWEEEYVLFKKVNKPHRHRKTDQKPNPQ